MSVQTITRSPANNNNTGELHYSDQFLQRLETDVECEKKKSKKHLAFMHNNEDDQQLS